MPEAQDRTRHGQGTHGLSLYQAATASSPAATNAFGVTGKPHSLPVPKWRANKDRPRPSTIDYITALRIELWDKVISPITTPAN
jgi:hypothetical protein